MIMLVKFKFCVFVFIVSVLAVFFGSCAQKATKLSSPVLQINKNGTITWQKTDNAVGYAYVVDGGEEKFTTDTQIRIAEGESVTVKAVGDGKNYLDSDFSEAVIRLKSVKPTIERVLAGRDAFTKENVDGTDVSLQADEREKAISEYLKTIEEQSKPSIFCTDLFLKEGQEFYIGAVLFNPDFVKIQKVSVNGVIFESDKIHVLYSGQKTCVFVSLTFSGLKTDYKIDGIYFENGKIESNDAITVSLAAQNLPQLRFFGEPTVTPTSFKADADILFTPDDSIKCCAFLLKNGGVAACLEVEKDTKTIEFCGLSDDTSYDFVLVYFADVGDGIKSYFLKDFLFKTPAAVTLTATANYYAFDDGKKGAEIVVETPIRCAEITALRLESGKSILNISAAQTEKLNADGKLEIRNEVLNSKTYTIYLDYFCAEQKTLTTKVTTPTYNNATLAQDGVTQDFYTFCDYYGVAELKNDDKTAAIKDLSVHVNDLCFGSLTAGEVQTTTKGYVFCIKDALTFLKTVPDFKTSEITLKITSDFNDGNGDVEYFLKIKNDMVQSDFFDEKADFNTSFDNVTDGQTLKFADFDGSRYIEKLTLFKNGYSLSQETNPDTQGYYPTYTDANGVCFDTTQAKTAKENLTINGKTYYFHSPLKIILKGTPHQKRIGEWTKQGDSFVHYCIEEVKTIYRCHDAKRQEYVEARKKTLKMWRNLILENIDNKLLYFSQLEQLFKNCKKYDATYTVSYDETLPVGEYGIAICTKDVRTGQIEATFLSDAKTTNKHEKLAPPTNVCFDKNFNLCWDKTDNAESYLLYDEQGNLIEPCGDFFEENGKIKVYYPTATGAKEGNVYVAAVPKKEYAFCLCDSDKSDGAIFTAEQKYPATVAPIFVSPQEKSDGDIMQRVLKKYDGEYDYSLAQFEAEWTRYLAKPVDLSALTYNVSVKIPHFDSGYVCCRVRVKQSLVYEQSQWSDYYEFFVTDGKTEITACYGADFKEKEPIFGTNKLKTTPKIDHQKMLGKEFTYLFKVSDYVNLYDDGRTINYDIEYAIYSTPPTDRTQTKFSATNDFASLNYVHGKYEKAYLCFRYKFCGDNEYLNSDWSDYAEICFETYADKDFNVKTRVTQVCVWNISATGEVTEQVFVSPVPAEQSMPVPSEYPQPKQLPQKKD